MCFQSNNASNGSSSSSSSHPLFQWHSEVDLIAKRNKGGGKSNIMTNGTLPNAFKSRSKSGGGGGGGNARKTTPPASQPPLVAKIMLAESKMRSGSDPQLVGKGKKGNAAENK